MIHRHKGRARGQALVEFALVFPIFMLIVFGLIDVGRLVFINNAVNQAAREGARFGSVMSYSAACNLGRDACIVENVKGKMTIVPPPLTPNPDWVAASCIRQSGAGTTTIPNADDCKSNDFLEVTIDTDVKFFIGIVTIEVHGESQVAVSN